MAESPLHSKTDLVTYTITVEGEAIKDTYQMKSLSIEKGVGKVSMAKIVFYDGDSDEETFAISESADFEPGKAVKIKLGYHSTETDAFEGIVTSQQVEVASFSHKVTSMLVVTCHDKAIKMTVARKSANYKDKKDSEVISTLAQDAGLSCTVDATTFKHTNLVQYNCTDWDFMMTRADANGLLVTNDAGKLEVKAPTVSGTEVLDLNFGTNIIDISAKMDSTPQLDKAQFNSWDGAQLKLINGAGAEPSANSQGNITGKKLAETVGKPAIELTTAAPEDTSLLKSWAGSYLQHVRLAKIQGHVTFVGSTSPLPGKLIKLEGFGARINGTAFITGVKHEVTSGNWRTTVQFGLDPKTFTDRFHEGISGPPAMGLLPPIGGVHIGTVKQIHEDPAGEKRVLVEVPSFDTTGDGVWARLLSPYASKDIGIYFYPETGDEVAVGFLNSDPRFPVILGSLFGKKNTPPFTPDDKNKDKGIVTKSKLKVTFDDDKKIITVETPGGQKVTLDDDDKSLKLEDQNNNSVELSSDGIVLNSGKDVKITAKGEIKLDATGKATVSSKQDVSIEGLNVKSKAKASLSAEGTASAEFKASGTVTVKGAMIMLN